jgi:hypothetical protein
MLLLPLCYISIKKFTDLHAVEPPGLSRCQMVQVFDVMQSFLIDKKALSGKRVCHLQQLVAISCNEDIPKIFVLLVRYRMMRCYFALDIFFRMLERESVPMWLSSSLLNGRVQGLLKVQGLLLQLFCFCLGGQSGLVLVARLKVVHLCIKCVVVDLGVADTAAHLGVVGDFELP